MPTRALTFELVCIHGHCHVCPSEDDDDDDEDAALILDQMYLRHTSHNTSSPSPFPSPPLPISAPIQSTAAAPRSVSLLRYANNSRSLCLYTGSLLTLMRTSTARRNKGMEARRAAAQAQFAAWGLLARNARGRRHRILKSPLYGDVMVN